MSEDTVKGVYCLTFPNGKRYVGIGMSEGGVYARFSVYKVLGGNTKSQTKLYNALKKYGPESVKYEHILKTSDSARAKAVERQLIALWGTQRNGYNITGGGDGTLGHTVSDEARRKISQANKGSKRTPEQRAAMSERSKKMSPERRHQLATMNIGKKLTDEHKEKISKAHKGRKPATHVMAALLASHIGAPMPPHVKEILLKRNLGSKKTEETKARMREAALLRWKKYKESKESNEQKK